MTAVPADCVCVDQCPESYPDNQCGHCRGLDSYDPCPVIGYGCGSGARAETVPCDCCTPEQWAAARGVKA